MPSASSLTEFKQAAADLAVAQVIDGMIVGLGTGSTAALAVNALGKRVQQGLRVIAIPTSEATAGQARGLGIPLSTLAEHSEIDLTIDGADEVELGTLNLIKGHGGALLREKIVASASAQLIIIVDETKLVERLGVHFAVPAEVVPFGWQATAKKLAQLGANPSLRRRDGGEPFITDGGHYILDCAFGAIPSPADLDRQLDGIVGVVEHGLFIGMTFQVIVGGKHGVDTLQPSSGAAARKL
jgi:ribose 5-phosphate isomerase A